MNVYKQNIWKYIGYKKEYKYNIFIFFFIQGEIMRYLCGKKSSWCLINYFTKRNYTTMQHFCNLICLEQLSIKTMYFIAPFYEENRLYYTVYACSWARRVGSIVAHTVCSSLAQPTDQCIKKSRYHTRLAMCRYHECVRKHQSLHLLLRTTKNM